MSSFQAKNAEGQVLHFQAEGNGTPQSPHVAHHFVSGGQVGVSGVVQVQPTVPVVSKVKFFSLPVGPAPVQLENVAARRAVEVKAANANAGTIYVGDSSQTGVGGFELGPGESNDWPLDNSNRLWLVGSVSGLLAYVGVY